MEHTLQSAGSSTCWRVSFSGRSVGLSLFQEAQLVSASSRLLALLGNSAHLRMSLSSPSCKYMLGVGSESGQFQRLLDATKLFVS